MSECLLSQSVTVVHCSSPARLDFASHVCGNSADRASQLRPVVYSTTFHQDRCLLSWQESLILASWGELPVEIVQGKNDK